MSKLTTALYATMLIFSNPVFAQQNSLFCEEKYVVTSIQGETFFDLTERLNKQLPSRMGLYELELSFGRENQTCIGGPLKVGTQLEYSVNCELMS